MSRWHSRCGPGGYSEGRAGEASAGWLLRRRPSQVTQVQFQNGMETVGR